MTDLTKLPKAALVSINDAQGVLHTYSVYVVELESGYYRGAVLKSDHVMLFYTPGEHGTPSEAFTDVCDRLWFYHDHPECPGAVEMSRALGLVP